MLLITRGLPGSGKTTLARKWVDIATPGQRVYIDRDDLRIMMFGRWGLLSGNEEDAVTIAQHAAIRSILLTGRSVVAADTFLRDDRLEPMLAIAAETGAYVNFIDLRKTPVADCIQRDAERGAAGGRLVGADVIQAMADRYGLPITKEAQ